jgi:hypothetical protein
VAVKVVTAAGTAEHSRGVDEPVDASIRHTLLVTRDGVPDEEMATTAIYVDEDAAVAAVKGPAEGGVGGEGYGCGGNEAGVRVAFEDLAPLDVAEQGRRAVEGSVLAKEVRVGEEVEPALADQGCAEKVLRLVRWEAEEDLACEVVHQLRRAAPPFGPFVILHRLHLQRAGNPSMLSELKNAQRNDQIDQANAAIDARVTKSMNLSTKGITATGTAPKLEAALSLSSSH